MSALRTLVGARALASVRSRRRPESPAELARRLDPKFVLTPTVVLLSDTAVRAVNEPDQRDVVTCPPRTGKSRLLSIWTPVWALMRDPDMQIMLVAYSDELATSFSREVRQIINAHADYLGFGISSDKSSTARFRIEGRAGQLIAVGIGSGITGQGCDLQLIDDPLKNHGEADSAAHRRRIWNEWGATLAPRVHPGGSVCLIQTRWHVEDLAGKLLDTEPDVWTYTNVPAVAATGIPDALNRAPGVVMTSALGYTAEHFAAARRTSGERIWWSLYEGVPGSPEGGLIKQDWLDTWRLAVPPSHPTKVVVAVDPSDSGSGDDCGLVAAALGPDGVIALLADVSEPLTAEQWSRRAVELAIETGASEISVETFAAGTTYLAVVNDAIKRIRPGRPIRVTGWPPRGSQRGRGDAEARSAGLRQALETGRCRVAGHLPAFEAQAVAWQSGQHQPDCLAAATIAFDVLAHAAGQQFTFTDPTALDRRRHAEGPRDPIAERLGIRPGLASVTAINPRLARRVGGQGYDPLSAPRRTIRGL